MVTTRRKAKRSGARKTPGSSLLRRASTRTPGSKIGSLPLRGQSGNSLKQSKLNKQTSLGGSQNSPVEQTEAALRSSGKSKRSKRRRRKEDVTAQQQKGIDSKLNSENDNVDESQKQENNRAEHVLGISSVTRIPDGSSEKKQQVEGHENEKEEFDPPINWRGLGPGCLTCRWRHRKCSRQEPVCITCVKAQVECCWRSPNTTFHQYKRNVTFNKSPKGVTLKPDVDEEVTREVAATTNGPPPTSVSGILEQTMDVSPVEKAARVASQHANPDIDEDIFFDEHTNIEDITTQLLQIERGDDCKTDQEKEGDRAVAKDGGELQFTGGIQRVTADAETEKETEGVHTQNRDSDDSTDIDPDSPGSFPSTQIIKEEMMMAVLDTMAEEKQKSLDMKESDLIDTDSSMSITQRPDFSYSSSEDEADVFHDASAHLCDLESAESQVPVLPHTQIIPNTPSPIKSNEPSILLTSNQNISKEPIEDGATLSVGPDGTEGRVEDKEMKESNRLFAFKTLILGGGEASSPQLHRPTSSNVLGWYTKHLGGSAKTAEERAQEVTKLMEESQPTTTKDDVREDEGAMHDNANCNDFPSFDREYHRSDKDIQEKHEAKAPAHIETANEFYDAIPELPTVSSGNQKVVKEKKNPKLPLKVKKIAKKTVKSSKPPDKALSALMLMDTLGDTKTIDLASVKQDGRRLRYKKEIKHVDVNKLPPSITQFLKKS
jgi:hypothetical protein